MVEKYAFQREETILQTKIFEIKKKRYLKPDLLTPYDAFVIDTADWANIIPVTQNNEILLVQEYRFGTDTIEWEIPGGIIEPAPTPVIVFTGEPSCFMS